MKKLSLFISLFFFLSLNISIAGGPIGGGPIGGISGAPVGGGSGGGAQLLVTGQTTSYHADDDGDLELGIARSYTVFTTGQYAGNTNITVNGKTHATSNACVKDNNTDRMWLREVIQADIGPTTDGKLYWGQWTLIGESVTFADVGGPGTDTITAAAGTPFDVVTLCVGRKFTVSGTVNNDGTYTVSAIANNKITTTENLVNEGPVATDFATIDDLIWDLADQANAASLAGYTDWRIPNKFELESLLDVSQVSPAIDGTIFPSTPNFKHWTSTSSPVGGGTSAWTLDFTEGYTVRDNKQNKRYYTRLVRN